MLKVKMLMNFKICKTLKRLVQNMEIQIIKIMNKQVSNATYPTNIKIITRCDSKLLYLNLKGICYIGIFELSLGKIKGGF